MLAMLFHVSAIKNHLPRILPRFSAETLFSSTVKQGLCCRSYQGAETKRKRNRFTVPFFWLPKLDSNQRPARVAVPGICLRQCIALPSADRCPFDRSLFLAQRAVALSAVHSDAAVKQGLRYCSYQGAETKRKRNRFTVPFLAPQVGLEPTTLRLTAACSTD